ncbi:MAG: YndJ family transporter, partial [Verrucomicrobiales bacterium]|nr:YndJ family transporter [Verrucomicrobiales bacterium]
WFAICGWMALRAASYCWRVGGSVSQLTLQSARCFPLVGAAWLLANRAGWMPFGFDALIVLLTAAHFHHAGFTLPLLAGKVSQTSPGRWSRATCFAVLAGVPLVAAGITATHFGLLPWLEPVAVALVVAGSLSAAALHLRLSLSTSRFGKWPRLLWAIAATSHIAAMALALGFGLRTWFPALALPMPQMWAIHGSLNAFGFGFLGLSAWALQPQDAD